MAELLDYEVYALRYGTHAKRSSRENFIAADIHDANMPLDYFIWAIKLGEDVVVVDTGFNWTAGEARGRTFLRSPADALRGIGIDASRVNDVIVTHLHYDHAGNLDLFPTARFYLQDTEMAFASGRHMGHACFSAAFDVEDVVSMVRRVYAGRVRFVEGDNHVRPGISLHRVGGHTDGLQVVRVHTARGWVVLASDASHYYANLTQRRPFPIVFNVGAVLEGYALLESLAESPDHIVPGHDPLVLSRYSAVAGNSNTVRLDLAPNRH